MKTARVTLIDLVLLCNTCREDEREQYSSLFGGPYDAEACAFDLYNRSRQGVSLTLYGDDGEPMMAGGWVEYEPGIWTSWMVATQAAWDTNWRSITKLSRKVMDQLFRDGARRLQINALATRTKTLQWYERGLKMQREGTLRGWCRDGRDLAMFGRLAGE